MLKEPPTLSPTKPLRPPSLRWLVLDGDSWWRRILRPVLLSIRLAILAIWWSGYGLGRALQTGWRLLVALCCLIKKEDYWVNWVFRVATAVSVGYLLYDRIYETAATLSISASDPHDPMMFPFSVTNNSHIFKIRHFHWTCWVISFVNAKNSGMANFGLTQKRSAEFTIDEGETLNFHCFKGNGMKIFDFGDAPVLKAEVMVEISYNSAFNAKLDEKTKFTWIGEASNPQWIRGEFAQ